MARFAACLTVALLLFATAAVGQQGLGPGPGPGYDPGMPPEVLVQGGFPPTIGVVEGVQGSRLILRHLDVRPTQETQKVPVTKRVVVDGREQEQTEYKDETFTRLRPVTAPFACELADIMAFDTDGQPIPPEVLATMFPRPRMVLMTFPGFPVDPAYLKLARDGTPFLAFLATPPPPNFAQRPASSSNPAQPGAPPAPNPPPAPAPPPSAPTTAAPAQPSAPPTTAPAAVDAPKADAPKADAPKADAPRAVPLPPPTPADTPKAAH